MTSPVSYTAEGYPERDNDDAGFQVGGLLVDASYIGVGSLSCHHIRYISREL
jgi:hypothetical protein